MVLQISVLHFVWSLLWTRSLNKTINGIFADNPSELNFKVRFLWHTVHFTQDRDVINQALYDCKYHPSQSYVQDNFNIFLGHRNTINTWENHHETHQLLKSVLPSAEKITDLLNKYSNIFMTRNSFDISDKLNEFLTCVWSEAVFGDTVDLKRFIDCRSKILHVMKIYHNSYVLRLPLIGRIAAYCYQLWNMKLLHEIQLDILLLELQSRISQTGLAHYLALNSGDNVINRYHLFLAFLVQDFLDKVFLDFIVTKGTMSSDSQNADFNKSLERGFMYPYRFLTLKDGETLVYNLVKSGLFFSGGYRACLGQNMVRKAFVPFFERMLKSPNFYLSRDKMPSANVYDFVEPCYHDKDDNIPQLIHSYRGKWVLKPDLSAILRSYPNHIGVPVYHNILNIYGSAEHFCYVVNYLGRLISHQVPAINGIIGIETRGLPLAGALASRFNLPFYMIRKGGSLPGHVFRESYNKYNNKESILELSKDDDLSGKTVAIVDDGISTGGTSLAAIKLAEAAEANVALFLTMVNHTKLGRIQQYENYNAITFSIWDI